jgi:tetratricopeptide (TPR) repeat protein
MAFSDKPEIPRAMVEHDMKNPTTFRHLHTSNRDDAQPAEACFQKRLAATIIRDFQSAVRLVRDHFPHDLDRLSGDLLFRIGVAFFQQADVGKARYCLELAAAKEGSWQHKAMLLVSRTYEAAGNDQRAITVIQDLLDQQPEKTFRQQALKRLMTLASQGRHQPAITDTV